MLKNDFLLKLDLQQFADDIDDNLDNEVVEDLDLEGELIAAIKQLNSEDDSDEDSEDEESEEDDTDIEDETDEDDLDDADEETDDDDEEEETTPEDTGKKKQSKEENAKFAKERREKEFQARLQAELDKLKQEAPEFKLAKQLSDMTGKPVDQIMDEMRESALRKQAEETKVPVEVLREQQKIKQDNEELQRQLNQLKFEQWQNQIKADGEKIQKDFNFLTDDDLAEAKSYILNVAKNVNMPLEDAVYAVHGKKIVQNLAKSKVQDELATQSGRKKKVPLAPNTGKASKAPVSLTAEEKQMAKIFGMSEEDYQKYKS